LAEYNETPEGGTIVDGEVAELLKHSANPIIFRAPRGHAYFGHTYINSDGGEVLVGGESLPEMVYGCVIEGGMLASGESIPTGSTTHFPEGGVLANGESVPVGGQTLPCEGGTLVGGGAEYYGSQTLVCEGGVVCGGTNLWTYEEATSGGVLLDGRATTRDTIKPVGGALVDGEADVEQVLTVGYQEFANGFKYRKPITCTCTNAPVLVHTVIYTPHRETDYDLDFYDYDGNRLPYEIENCDEDTGELYAWVLANVTSFYVYYGKYITESLEGDVWDSDYQAVYHLAESGNGTANEFQDSANAYHGQGGVPNDSPTLQTDFTQKFDGTDHINCLVDGGEQTLTVSGRVKLTNCIGNGIMFSRGYDDGNGHGWNILLGHDYARRPYAAVQTVHGLQWVTNSIRGSALSLNTWYHLAATYDGTLKLYLNGVLVASKVINEDLASVGAYSYISRWNTDSAIRGYIDEVRVSSVVRTSDYLLCEATNTATVGQEQIPLQLNGTAPVEDVLPTAGGVKLAGTAPPSQIFDHTNEAGVLVAGTATIRHRNVLTAAGGMLADGVASYGRRYTNTAAGGVRVAGSAARELTLPITGGVRCAGHAPHSNALDASGGLLANGSSSPSQRITTPTTGQGVVISGTASVQHVQVYRFGGGVVIDGRHTKVRNTVITPHGGMKASGTARPTYHYAQTTDGGIVANGAGQMSQRFRPSSSGGLVADGSTPAPASYLHSPQSGVVLSGNPSGLAAYLIAPSSGALLGGTVKFAWPIMLGSITAYSVLDGDITTHTNATGNITTQTRFGGEITCQN
jgi:hypothetical protein